MLPIAHLDVLLYRLLDDGYLDLLLLRLAALGLELELELDLGGLRRGGRSPASSLGLLLERDLVQSSLECSGAPRPPPTQSQLLVLGPLREKAVVVAGSANLKLIRTAGVDADHRHGVFLEGKSVLLACTAGRSEVAGDFCAGGETKSERRERVSSLGQRRRFLGQGAKYFDGDKSGKM